MSKSRKSKNAGFTLIEVMIALTIIVVIGAIAAVNLISRVSTSKIRADIQSTIVLRSALDLYEAELQTTALTRTNVAQDLGNLVANGYITSSALVSQAGGTWVYDNKVLYISYAGKTSVLTACDELSNSEKSYIYEKKQ